MTTNSPLVSRIIISRVILITKVTLLLYLFLISIELLGKSFKLFGEDAARELLDSCTDNRFVGLFVGILTTSLVQSSSTVTGMVVGFVGGGALSLSNAIPIVIGANIGTTITNSLVSLGHLHRRGEFKKALAAATVHDFFNIITVLIVFPLELIFSPLERISGFLIEFVPKTTFSTGKGPLHSILGPPVKAVVEMIESFEGGNWFFILRMLLVLVALALLFGSLFFLVKVLKGYMLARLEAFFGRYLFKNPFVGMFLGMMITGIVQSSSVTTSLMVPMAGAGILTIYQIYPFTLGANLGTTITAFIASMATTSVGGLQIAICHCLFNIIGISIFYPLKELPITMARRFADLASRKRKYAFIFIGFLFFLVPSSIIFISKLLF